MEPWARDILRLLAEGSLCESDIHRCLEDAANYLGFEYFSYAFQQVLPVSQPRFRWVTNYPKAWRRRYIEAGHIPIDPRISRARLSQESFAWGAELFRRVPELWKDMQHHGLACGMTQSVSDGPGGISMLSLVRASPQVKPEELALKRDEMFRLAQITHRMMSRKLREEAASRLPSLTCREIEVLRWTADGKSAQDIADILSLSKNTIDFHIKNSISKMGVPNKTAAVARAALLGLLNQNIS